MKDHQCKMRGEFSLRLLMSLLAASVLWGCASPIGLADLRPPNPLQDGMTHAYSVLVTAGGGEETDRLSTHSRVDDSALRQAVVVALTDSAVFQSVVTDEEAELTLNVQLLQASQPDVGGFNSESTCVMRWTLTDTRTGSLVLEFFVEEAFAATDLIGATRFRNAVSGAVRAAIASGVRRLATENLFDSVAR